MTRIQKIYCGLGVAILLVMYMLHSNYNNTKTSQTHIKWGRECYNFKLSLEDCYRLADITDEQVKLGVAAGFEERRLEKIGDKN
jgi:hypothetical protein